MGRKSGADVRNLEVGNGVRQRGARFTETIEGEVGEGCGVFFDWGVSAPEVNGGDSGRKFGDLALVPAFKSQASD